MELALYRTLWGVLEPITELAPRLRKAGFEGVEGRVPLGVESRHAFKQALEETELDYIGIIFTGGDVIPDQSKSVDDHLAILT